jgi:hypothetical protein
MPNSLPSWLRSNDPFESFARGFALAEESEGREFQRQLQERESARQDLISKLNQERHQKQLELMAAQIRAAQSNNQILTDTTTQIANIFQAFVDSVKNVTGDEQGDNAVVRFLEAVSQNPLAHKLGADLHQLLVQQQNAAKMARAEAAMTQQTQQAMKEIATVDVYDPDAIQRLADIMSRYPLAFKNKDIQQFYQNINKEVQDIRNKATDIVNKGAARNYAEAVAMLKNGPSGQDFEAISALSRQRDILLRMRNLSGKTEVDNDVLKELSKLDDAPGVPKPEPGAPISDVIQWLENKINELKNRWNTGATKFQFGTGTTPINIRSPSLPHGVSANNRIEVAGVPSSSFGLPRQFQNVPNVGTITFGPAGQSEGQFQQNLMPGVGGWAPSQGSNLGINQSLISPTPGMTTPTVAPSGTHIITLPNGVKIRVLNR